MDSSTGAVARSAATTTPKKQKKATKKDNGLVFERYFTTAGVDPYDTVAWELRDAVIGSPTGEIVFEQRAVEVPSAWSPTATNVVVSKYFRGHLDTPGRERSVRQLIGRVCDTVSQWGREDGYFKTDEDAQSFRDELTWLCLHQHMAFNSPVWFNVGCEEHPQCSACFINSVDDTMESILGLAKTEGMLFKWGSGAGSNLSVIRSSKETLRGGGTASGPVSFMRGFDAFAGVIKSGGKTRRAAKMVILDVDHPDVLDFVNCKSEEEQKAWTLIDAGYDGGFNVPGGAYDSVFYQNANHSVRVSDDFMEAVLADGDWSTKTRTGGEIVDTLKARDIMTQISEAAWLCGDPGLQYDTTINDWHTCSNTDRIYASNPCSEYMFLDDSACNLASLNLMKFRNEDGDFDQERFQKAVNLVLTAQEIFVDRASYPTEAIGKNSHVYRPLGLGYANLGALLMARGLPYDSVDGRAYAGVITAIMHGQANVQSAKIAALKGAFEGYARNADPMLRVMGKHRKAAAELPKSLPADLLDCANTTWTEAVELGRKYGFRNSQVTVLAPTGTIGFMMDCDTTGVEPDIALIKYKKLVGGGLIKIVNQTVPLALEQLGYTPLECKAILAYLNENETIEGAPYLKDEHLAVFDCAFQAAKGTRSIAPMGHMEMMGAAQPFLSGAISKTVNLPNDSTPADIAEMYIKSWQLGLKAVAIYRDGCKRTQPLNTSLEAANSDGTKPEVERIVEYRPVRRKLPATRQAITHKFSIDNHDGYITAGLYEDGMPGEIFLVMAKEGSVVSGLMDTFATSVSLSLQYGVPLSVMCNKFSHTRFEPSGFTGNPDIPIAKSITDYIFRWLELTFIKNSVATLSFGGAGSFGGVAQSAAKETALPAASMSADADMEGKVFVSQADAPPCHVCCSIMVRSGACYKCLNCGATSGCS
jgi:ribonucleoside-diphosphate reductase alpha chain